jgi:hypothetical protein
MNYDTLTVLRNYADGAEVADASETGIALDLLRLGPTEAVLFVTDLHAATGDGVYTIYVEAATAVGFGTSAILASLTVDAVGEYPLAIGNGASIGAQLAAPTHIRCRLDVTGSAGDPSITYGCYLRPQTVRKATIANRA